MPRGRSRSPFHEAVGAVLELIGVKAPGGGHTPEERIKVLLEEGAWAGAFGEAEHAGLVWKPNVMAPVDQAQAQSVMALVEALEDNDDVQTVTTNFEVSDEVMQKMLAAG